MNKPDLPERSRLQMQFSSLKGEVVVFYLCFIGIAIVYLTHLGLVPIHSVWDECRRALVAMEMHISGDFLTPTLNGEPYLNKPPLFSWIIALSFEVFGDFSAFALRFPVVLSILGHGLLIFFIVKRYSTDAAAAMTALAFMTNGRTLMFDSMLGLLENTLALLLYAGFMAIFIFGEKKKYFLLFTVSYFITALGFLIKGLPSVAHQGIALAVYFIFTRQFKILFSRYHIAGVFVFLFTLAAYYIPYFSHNQLSPEILFSKIVNESSKRYEFKGIGEFFMVFIRYPRNFFYHFLPWTLLLVLLIRKDVLPLMRQNKFVFYNMLLFLANTPVYWLAAYKNPHYLYFLLPLIFTPLFYIYFQFTATDWRVRIVERILWVGIGIGVVALGYVPFNKPAIDVPGAWVKLIFSFMAFLGLFLLYTKRREYRLFVFVGILIFTRLAFNWFVLPQRVSAEDVYINRARQVFQIVQGQPLFIMADYPAGFYDPITYYMEEYRNDILRLNKHIDYNAFYLVDDVYLEKYPHEILLKFPFDYADNNLRYKKEMFLVKFVRN